MGVRAEQISSTTSLSRDGRDDMRGRWSRTASTDQLPNTRSVGGAGLRLTDQRRATQNNVSRSGPDTALIAERGGLRPSAVPALAESRHATTSPSTRPNASSIPRSRGIRKSASESTRQWGRPAPTCAWSESTTTCAASAETDSCPWATGAGCEEAEPRAGTATQNSTIKPTIALSDLPGGRPELCIVAATLALDANVEPILRT